MPHIIYVALYLVVLTVEHLFVVFVFEKLAAYRTCTITCLYCMDWLVLDHCQVHKPRCVKSLK